MEIDQETLQKARYFNLLAQHHRELAERMEADVCRLVEKSTGIENGEIDLDKGVVNEPNQLK